MSQLEVDLNFTTRFDHLSCLWPVGVRTLAQGV